MSTLTRIVIEGPGPWGFRLVGGKDFDQPLSISRVGWVINRILNGWELPSNYSPLNAMQQELSRHGLWIGNNLIILNGRFAALDLLGKGRGPERIAQNARAEIFSQLGHSLPYFGFSKEQRFLERDSKK